MLTSAAGNRRARKVERQECHKASHYLLSVFNRVTSTSLHTLEEDMRQVRFVPEMCPAQYAAVLAGGSVHDNKLPATASGRGAPAVAAAPSEPLEPQSCAFLHVFAGVFQRKFFQTCECSFFPLYCHVLGALERLVLESSSEPKEERGGAAGGHHWDPLEETGLPTLFETEGAEGRPLRWFRCWLADMLLLTLQQHVRPLADEEQAERPAADPFQEQADKDAAECAARALGWLVLARMAPASLLAQRVVKPCRDALYAALRPHEAATAPDPAAISLLINVLLHVGQVLLYRYELCVFALQRATEGPPVLSSATAADSSQPPSHIATFYLRWQAEARAALRNIKYMDTYLRTGLPHKLQAYRCIHRPSRGEDSSDADRKEDNASADAAETNDASGISLICGAVRNDVLLQEIMKVLIHIEQYNVATTAEQEAGGGAAYRMSYRTVVGVELTLSRYRCLCREEEEEEETSLR